MKNRNKSSGGMQTTMNLYHINTGWKLKVNFSVQNDSRVKYTENAAQDLPHSIKLCISVQYHFLL